LSSTTQHREIDDDLFAPELIADPFPYYDRLREVDPVHWNERNKVWIVTRYDDVSWLTSHPELFSSAVDARDPLPPYPPIEPGEEDDAAYVKRNIRGRLIQAEPPTHTKRRAVLKKYFSPAVIKQWRPMIAHAVASLLDEVQDRGRMDVMRDLAIPLPLMVICEIMDIPKEQRLEIRAVAQKLLVGPLAIPNRMSVLADAMRTMDTFMEPLVKERIEHPSNDLVSLVAGAERDGVYDHEAVLQNLAFFVVAGHETTINLICNGLLAFMRHPDQWDLLCSDPKKFAASATEECLRYDPPAPSLERIASADIELRGKTIRKFDRVRWFNSAANRDPEKFPDPEHFDITRSPNAHLSFGHGIHFCLGAHLARIEGQEVFPALATRFPRFKLETDPLEYVPAIHVRSLKTLEVSW
jgi:pimeloyl-[acyl-carrier protein] synthase